jgi:hypothetical protein
VERGAVEVPAEGPEQHAHAGQAGRREGRRAGGEEDGLERRERVLEEDARGGEQRHAEHALHGVHPGPALGERDGEGADEEEEEAEPQRVGEHDADAEGDRALGGDEGQRGGEHRARARGGDDAGDEPHGERPEVAGAADALELRLPGRRELQLEGAEHRGGHGGEDERHPADHERVLHDAPEGPPGQRRADAERRVHEGDAEDVEAGERHGVAPGGGLAGPEDRDGDGDERIDAGGEARQDAAAEGDDVGEPGALGEERRQAEIGRGAGGPAGQQIGQPGHAGDGDGGDQDSRQDPHSSFQHNHSQAGKNLRRDGVLAARPALTRPPTPL